MYGITGDRLGTDAIGRIPFPSHSIPVLRVVVPLVNFINNRDPNYPKGSTVPSLLSNVTWPKYTLDSKEMLLFSDDAAEEYTTIPDTYRADAIDAIVQLQTALGA